MEIETKDSRGNGMVLVEGLLDHPVDDLLHIGARLPVIPILELRIGNVTHAQCQCYHKHGQHRNCLQVPHRPSLSGKAAGPAYSRRSESCADTKVTAVRARSVVGFVASAIYR